MDKTREKGGEVLKTTLNLLVWVTFYTVIWLIKTRNATEKGSKKG